MLRCLHGDSSLLRGETFFDQDKERPILFVVNWVVIYACMIFGLKIFKVNVCEKIYSFGFSLDVLISCLECFEACYLGAL